MWSKIITRFTKCGDTKETYKMAITVSSKKEAWELAAKLFPTDWEKDEESSERAGYPIYKSTAANRPGFWISDLNTRLELNMGSETVNININSNNSIEDMGRDEKNTFSEELSSWLGYYTDEVITRVMDRIDEIAADKASRMMIHELHIRETEERNGFADQLRWGLDGTPPRMWRNDILTHAQSYRDVLHDLWLTD